MNNVKQIISLFNLLLPSVAQMWHMCDTLKTISVICSLCSDSVNEATPPRTGESVLIMLLFLVLLQELTSLHPMQQLVLMPPAHLPSPSPFLLSQSPSSHQGRVSGNAPQHRCKLSLYSMFGRWDMENLYELIRNFWTLRSSFKTGD